MKKIIPLFLFTLFFLIYALPLLAQNRPPGLDNRGPLTKITFIHYKKGYAKPPNSGKPDKPGRPPKQSSCYDFLAKGAKWKTTEPYFINPTNNDGLSSQFITNSFKIGTTMWEAYSGVNIFGSVSIGSTASYGTYDQINMVEFKNYSNPGVIAVTSVWGYFNGPPGTRELVEWDMLLNDNYNWGDASTESSLMDLQNIVTHELGHSAGMDDLYETACQAETMYGYSIEGETSKRDLGPGDITGIQKLYQ